jgi:hypothetical protein
MLSLLLLLSEDSGRFGFVEELLLTTLSAERAERFSAFSDVVVVVVAAVLTEDGDASGSESKASDGWRGMEFRLEVDGRRLGERKEESSACASGAMGLGSPVNSRVGGQSGKTAEEEQDEPGRSLAAALSFWWRVPPSGRPC